VKDPLDSINGWVVIESFSLRLKTEEEEALMYVDNSEVQTLKFSIYWETLRIYY